MSPSSQDRRIGPASQDAAAATINLLRSLHGAQLYVLVALKIAGRAVGVAWLVAATHYDTEAVSASLRRLAELGLASNVGRYAGWQLTSKGLQLPLFTLFGLLGGTPENPVSQLLECDPVDGRPENPVSKPENPVSPEIEDAWEPERETGKPGLETGKPGLAAKNDAALAAEVDGRPENPVSKPENPVSTAGFRQSNLAPRSGRSLTNSTFQNKDLPDLGGGTGEPPPEESPGAKSSYSEREQSERLLDLAGLQSAKDIQRLAASLPFLELFGHVKTWQREGGSQGKLGPGALLNRIDRHYRTDPLPDAYQCDPLYLEATGLSPDEARRRRYVPAGYEDLIEH